MPSGPWPGGAAHALLAADTGQYLPPTRAAGTPMSFYGAARRAHVLTVALPRARFTLARRIAANSAMGELPMRLRLYRVCCAIAASCRRLLRCTMMRALLRAEHRLGSRSEQDYISAYDPSSNRRAKKGIPVKKLFIFLTLIAGLCGPPAQGHDIGPGHAPSWDPPVPTQEQRDAMPEVNALRYVIDRYKLWRTGTVLTICFYDSTPERRRAVADIARIWTHYAHVTFDFGPDPALRSCAAQTPSHIRIAFQKSGNWSYVGRDSVAVDLGQPSMNLEVASSTPLALIEPHELQRVVLHEFGHAIGLQHEHQSPKSDCEAEFNWPIIYTEMGKPPNNWSRTTVDANLRALIVSPRLEISPYDKTSIMHYSLPSWMFRGGQKATCFVAPNETLSDLDQLGAKAAYPETLEAQTRYLDTVDGAARSVLTERQISPKVAQGVEDQINSALANAQGFPGRTFHYDQIVCAQQGVAVNGNIVGSTVTNTVTNSTNSGPCVGNRP
jgi:Astacin (Peptidase family M12A)